MAALTKALGVGRCLGGLTFLAFSAGLIAFAVRGIAVAQTMELTVPGAEDLVLHDTGWQHLADPDELILFALDVLVTFLITAAIAYHPSIRAERRTVADFKLPRMLFAYGLIGMTVGFLVLHHGYLIGFVIFGIGALLRFRTSGDTPLETVRMILVTIMGLCVGLDLPGMAVLVTTIAWGVFYIIGATEYHAVEVKLADDKHLDDAISSMRAMIEEAGGSVVSTNRQRFKQTVEFVVATRRGTGGERLARALAARKAEKQGGLSDWHIV